MNTQISSIDPSFVQAAFLPRAFVRGLLQPLLIIDLLINKQLK